MEEPEICTPLTVEEEVIAPFRVVVPVPFKIRALVPTLMVLATVTRPSPETEKFALPNVIDVPVNVKLWFRR